MAGKVLPGDIIQIATIFIDSDSEASGSQVQTFKYTPKSKSNSESQEGSSSLKGKRKESDPKELDPSPKKCNKELIAGDISDSSSLPSTSTSSPKSKEGSSPNEFIIKELQKLVSRYEAEGDRWRLRTYQRAIKTLRKYSKRVESGKEAGELEGIGAKTAQKIQEIIDTGRLQKTLETPENIKCLSLFHQIHGVGATTARKWYDEGMRTLDDIKKRKDITKAHQVSLHYFDDLQQRIPRKEVSQIGQVVETYARKFDPQVNVIISGSYRRGALECGDVDILRKFIVIQCTPEMKSHLILSQSLFKK